MSSAAAEEIRIKSINELEVVGGANKVLGQGAYAKVKLVRLKKTGQLFALKELDLAKETSGQVSKEKRMEIIKREIKLHKKLSHENIIRLVDFFKLKDNIYLLMEYAEKGNLFHFIRQHKKLDEARAVRYFGQTCQGIRYLHANSICHRDLKPENLLLTRDDVLKICDFGWSVNQIDDMRVTFCGTYEYMAPEIIDNVGYDKKVDLWSLGILLYELLHGFSPFRGDNPSIVFKNIKAGVLRFASDVSPEAKHLIAGILKREPHLRLTIDEILAHPLFQKYAQPPQQLQQQQPSRALLSLDRRDWGARPAEEPAKEAAGGAAGLPPRSQSRTYSQVERRANASPVVVRAKAGEPGEEPSAKSQFEDLLSLHKKEILGTNNPLKSFLSKNLDLLPHGYLSQQEALQAPHAPRPELYASSKLLLAPPLQDSPGKLPFAQGLEPWPLRPQQPGPAPGVSAGVSARYLPAGAGFPRQPATAGAGAQLHGSVLHASKSSLQQHQRNASFTSVPRVGQHTPISTRSKSRLDSSQNRSRSNRSIFEPDDAVPLLGDCALAQPRPAGVKLDRHLKRQFEEIVRGHQPHSRSEAAGLATRPREDSRDQAGDAGAAAYRPLLSRRAEPGSRDGSVGRPADRSSSKRLHDRSDSFLLPRLREDSADPRAYASSNQPALPTLAHSALRQQAANLFRDESFAGPKKTEPVRPEPPGPAHLNKENSRLFSNREQARQAPGPRAPLEAQLASAKPYVPYASGLQAPAAGPRPPVSRLEGVRAEGYLSSQLGRYHSHQLPTNNNC